jgi:tetratricopeptide (TPR) repeat protein
MVKTTLIQLLLGGVILLSAGCGRNSQLKSYMNGIEAYKKGHYALARKKLEHALEQRPDDAADAPAYNFLGLSAARTGDAAAAKAAFVKSHALDGYYYEACYNLGATLCGEGDLKEGPGMLMRAASINRQDARPLELLADFYYKRGMVNEARSMLQIARQRAPNSPRIFTRMAVSGLEHEGAGYTSSYLAEALEYDPDYPVAVFNRAVLHDQWVNDREGALSYYRRYLELAANGPGRESAESAIARLEQAIAHDFSAATSTNPVPEVYPREADVAPEIPLKVGTVRLPDTVGDPETDPLSVEGMLAEAKELVIAGNEDKALNLCLQVAARASREKDIALEEKALRTAVALCTDQPRAHFALGRYLNERGEYQQAMRAFQKASEIKPLWEEAHLSTAAAAIACSEFQAALVALRKAVNSAPGNPDALWALALFYDTQLKLESSAHRSFSQFLSLFPEDHRAIEARERLKSLTPDPPSAPVMVRPVGAVPAAPRKLTHQMVTVDTPDDMGHPSAVVGEAANPATATANVGTFKSEKILTPKAAPVVDYRKRANEHFEQGTRYQAKGDFDRAMLYYQQSINEDPTFASPFYNMGIIYQKQNQLEHARNAYAKVLEIDETQVNARYNLALIFQELGQTDEAQTAFARIVQEQPDYAPAHFMLAQAFAEDPNQVERVRMHYTRFLELAPDDEGVPEARRWLLRN